VSNIDALAESQKARLFDQLKAHEVLRWRDAPREERRKTVRRIFIEHGATKDMLVEED
jgi:hypothetical protein